MKRATGALLLLTFLATASHAADPRIRRLEPPGAQRGGEVSLRIVGDRVNNEPEGLLFNEPGIELVEVTKGEKNVVEAKLKIADDCTLGPHALRLRTASGLSNLVTFNIGALPEIKEAEPNNSENSPQSIEHGVVVNGVVEREDIDCFAVQLAEGERLSVDVEGLRLGRTFFDPWLEVIGPAGEIVAASDDARPTHQDPSLSLKAPVAGRYVLRLRESAMRGDGNCVYRLHVGRFPRPAAVFPPVVQRDTPHELRWVDPAGDEAVTYETRLVGKGDEAMAFAFDEHGASPTGLPVRLVDHPVATEAEPNNQPKEALATSAPVALAGVISDTGDKDHFRFTAKKGENWDLRAYARGVRSPLDPVVRVLDANGKWLAGNDDDRGKPDSYLRFKAPADGDYIVQVDDHLRRGGPDYVYCVDVTRPSPQVELNLHEQRRYIATPIDVPQSGRIAVLLNARRIDVGGGMTIGVDGLPEGVTYEAPPIPGNYNRIPVVFSAEESAETTATLVNFNAQREGEGPLGDFFRQQEWFVRGRNNVPMWSHFADRAAVAVTKKLPFSIRLEEPKAPLVQNGSTTLRVIAERGSIGEDKTFGESIRVRMIYHSPGVSSNQSRSIAKDKSEAEIPVTADGGARTGEWPIVVLGETNYGGRTVVSTQLVTLRVAEPHLALSLPKMATAQGASVDYTIAIEPKTSFEGAARCELLGLPPGVTSQPLEVAHDATSATFRLDVAADARVGHHRSLACRVVLQENGAPVTHTMRGGQLVVDPAPKQAEPETQQTASGQDTGQEVSS